MKRMLILILTLCCLAGCGEESQANDGRMVIALLDTGVSTAAIDSSRLLPGHNYVADSDDTTDRTDHGTAVASAILGSTAANVAAAAPNAYVVPLVVVDRTESGAIQRTSAQVLAQAIRDAVDVYGADIINLSLGIRSDVDALREAVAYAEQHGVLVVSAVGNSGREDTQYYPASYDTVLAVGSHDENGQVSDFSQQNGTADLLAPGEDIWLASRNGLPYGAKGTSYATGFVSAAAALLLETDPTLSPAALRQQLVDSFGNSAVSQAPSVVQ